MQIPGGGDGMTYEKINELEREIDKLRSQPESSDLVVSLNDIALTSIHLDPEKAKAYALEAFNLAGKLGILNEQARSNLTQAIYYLEVGNFDEALTQCSHAMEIYRNLEDNDGIASVFSKHANVFFAQGLIDKALEYYHMALKKKQECEANEEQLASYYFNVGVCYVTLDKLELALSFYKHAAACWEKSGNLMYLAHLYNNMGSVFGKKKNLVKAREYFHKAFAIREDIGDKAGLAITLSNLGNLHDDLFEYQEAVDYYTRSLKLYEEIGNQRGIANVCGSVGAIYIKLQRLDEAEEFIGRGLSIARELELKDTEIRCLENITDLYEAKDDLKKALKCLRELKTCIEEHLNDESMEKIARLQVQFETEQKEKEAEIYRLKNIELSKKNDQLRAAMMHVRKLQGMLPICASCKKIRDDDGYWQQIDSYISDHSDTKFSHGLCPECMLRLYGEDFSKKHNQQ